jgi:hypothetical protein
MYVVHDWYSHIGDGNPRAGELSRVVLSRTKLIMIVTQPPLAQGTKTTNQWSGRGNMLTRGI